MINGSAVEVIYALASHQVRLLLWVPAGSSVVDAIRKSGLLSAQPEIDLSRNKLGIFGRLVNPDTPVRDGDRIEIYRPLATNPKETRRQRAGIAKNRN